jgi:TonB-dependent SusC/RagA subfamily outer membrane receptor
LTSVSDDKGIFHFNNLAFTDTVHFVLSAVKENGKNSTRISYFNKEPQPAVAVDQLQNTPIVKDTVMAAYLNNDTMQQGELVKHGVVKLKEVKIKVKKLDDNYRTQSLAGPGHADQVMHADEIGQIPGQLSTSLNGRLRMVVFLGPKQTPYLTGGLGRGPMLVIVDGVEGADITYLSTNDVETVEVLKGASASIYGMAGGHGVLIITTKQGDERNDNVASIGVLSIAVNGFYKAREFYSPKYDASSHANSGADLRSTIFWQPEVVTDKDGNASFDYYNADGRGNYRVVIEGMDENGNIGRQVYRYRVE